MAAWVVCWWVRSLNFSPPFHDSIAFTTRTCGNAGLNQLRSSTRAGLCGSTFVNIVALQRAFQLALSMFFFFSNRVLKTRLCVLWLGARQGFFLANAFRNTTAGLSSVLCQVTPIQDPKLWWCTHQVNLSGDGSPADDSHRRSNTS